MDMSNSYYWAVRGTLPHVDIVFDRYHVTALMNKAIDEFRRDYFNSLQEADKKAMKGIRFLLLKNYDSLETDKKTRLRILMETNEPLFIIHSMKEQLRLFWEKPDHESAYRFLNTWCKDAVDSKIKQLKRVATTIAGYKTGLLAFFKHRISNGPVEGLNNKIKTLKRSVYGFRNMEYFKLRLYHLHVQRYSLTG